MTMNQIRIDCIRFAQKENTISEKIINSPTVLNIILVFSLELHAIVPLDVSILYAGDFDSINQLIP